MKNLFIFFMMVICNLSAHDSSELWTGALLAFSEEDYILAEEKLNFAISLMEDNASITDYPYIFVDRARVNFQLNKFEDAVADANKALLFNNLSEKEKLNAVTIRAISKSHLGISEGVLDDINYVGEHYAPNIEITENKIIMRNVPESNCYCKIMKCFLIHSNICNNKKDIKIIKPGIWLIDRKANFENLPINKKCDECGKELAFIENRKCSAEGCRSWCDANALIASGWCGKVFKRIDCSVACMGAVYVVQKLCYACCSKGNFYETCITPFGKLVDYMKVPCDPEWD